MEMNLWLLDAEHSAFSTSKEIDPFHYHWQNLVDAESHIGQSDMCSRFPIHQHQGNMLARHRYVANFCDV